MTVAELIAELSKLPLDARVVIVASAAGEQPISFPVLCCTEYEPGEITLEY